MSVPILQIAPNKQDAVCGIGDYARILGRELETRHGFTSQYARGRDQAALKNLTQSASKLTDFKAVIIHYSAYGYSMRGTPFGFVRSLQRISAQLPILTMFHEMEASGPITSSSFWLRPIQYWLIQKVARLSSALHTNLSLFESRLKKISDVDLRCTPVFSNLGETTSPSLVSTRTKKLVVYQPPPYHHDGSKAFWTSLRNLTSSLHPEEILYAGRCEDTPDYLSGRRLGFLDRRQAQELLSTAAWAFMQYPAHCLSKSGMFAAHAANGICTFLHSLTDSDADGLKPNYHYFIPASASNVSQQELESAALNLHSWYQSHSIKATAARYAEQIEKMLLNHTAPNS